jgi:hypothetical protein
MSDYDDLVEEVEQQRSQRNTSEDTDDSDEDTYVGVVSGYGDSGDAVVKCPELRETVFVKSADTREVATPKDVVAFDIVHEKESVVYARIVDIREQNRESKGELLSDIADLQGDGDDILNSRNDGRPASFNRAGAYKLRNYLAYLERQSSRVGRLKDRVDQLESKLDE